VVAKWQVEELPNSGTSLRLGGNGARSVAPEQTDRAGAGLGTPAPGVSFDRIAAVAARATGAAIAAVTLVDGAEQVLVGFAGSLQPLAAHRTAPVRGSFLEQLMRRRTGLAVADARTDPDMQRVGTIADLGIVAYAGAPIVDHEGTIAGAVIAADEQPHPWPAAGLATLTDLAGAVAAALARRAGGTISPSETRMAAAQTRVTEAIAFGEPVQLTLARIVDALEAYITGAAVGVCIAGRGADDPQEFIGQTGETELMSLELRGSSGRHLGRLTVSEPEPRRPLTPAHERGVRAFAELARIAIERSRERHLSAGAVQAAGGDELDRMVSFAWTRDGDRLALGDELRALVDDTVHAPATAAELLAGWVAGEDRVAFTDAWLRALRGRRSEFRAEARIAPPGDAQRVVAITAHIQRDNAGSVTGMLGVAQDVTGRRSGGSPDAPGRRMVQSVVELPIALALVDAAGTVEVAGATLCRILGAHRSALCGQPVDALVFEADRELFDRTRRHPDSPDTTVIRLQRRDGAVTWAHVRFMPAAAAGDGRRLLVARPAAMPDDGRADAPGARGRDRLTGLPDRQSFVEALEDRLAGVDDEQPRQGVLAIGIDSFKAVNESLGHAAGDEALATVARRLRAAVPCNDVVARFEGDQFVVLFADADGDSHADTIARRVQEAVAAPISLGDHTLRLSASVGVAIDDPGAVGVDLVRDAEIAMHRAKRERPGSVKRFLPPLRDEAMAQLRAAHDLRSALERGELRLAFEPMVALEPPRSIAGLEAVVRWQHPARGLLQAADFMPQAMQLGLSGDVDRWVVRRVCELHALWREENRGRESPVVSVNVPTPELSEPGFVEHLEIVLEETGMPRDKLTLEIVETALVGPAGAEAASVRALERVRGLGVRVALDEFGTGYSSLGRLVRYPLDGLKLESSFVAGMAESGEAAAVVDATMRMAAVVGLGVVAQGVETEDQARRLLRLGCRFGQGPLFARAIPEAVVGRTLRRALPPEGTVEKGVPRFSKPEDAQAAPSAGEGSASAPDAAGGPGAAEPGGAGAPDGGAAEKRPPRSGRLVTLNRACAALNVSPTTLRRWADEGRIEAVRTPGGHRRFYLADVARLQAERAVAS